MSKVKPAADHIWDDTTGGQNDTDSPFRLRPNQCVSIINVDWKDTDFGRKRGGASSLSMTGGTAFASSIPFLGRHTPGNSLTSAELWAIDVDGSPVKRLAGGTSWANVTLADAIATNVKDIQAVSLNGKYFVAYDSTQDRLHVYEAAAASVRRVGLAPGSNAPTVANTGAGAYAATLRYYRVRFMIYHGTGLLYALSEPTPSVSFTPSGGGTAARVTRPTAPGEGETHWIVEASTDNVDFYTLTDIPNSGILMATTTYDDSAAVATYDDNDISYQAGLFNLFPSVKHLLTDGNRILGATAWESSGANSGGKTARIWFTPVLGTLDVGDDERIVNTTTQKNYVDLNEKDGGEIIGLGGPLNGVVVAFKARQVWALRPTGDVTNPYLARRLRDDIGCVFNRSIAIGEDQIGRPALYWMSHRGPYRITFDGVVEYLGGDNEVTWRTMDPAVDIPAHSVYYPDLHQWWVWIAQAGNNTPNLKMMFDVQKGYPDENGQIRGGWATHTGPSAEAACACLFSNTVGASMSLDMKPYITRTTTILKCDTSDLDDAGTDIQATIKGRPLVAPPGHKIGMEEPYLNARALSGVTLTYATDRDFGKETRSHTVTLTAETTETRIDKKVEGVAVGEANTIQVTVGDGAAQEGAWTIDRLIIPVTAQERR